MYAYRLSNDLSCSRSKSTRPHRINALVLIFVATCLAGFHVTFHEQALTETQMHILPYIFCLTSVVLGFELWISASPMRDRSSWIELIKHLHLQSVRKYRDYFSGHSFNYSELVQLIRSYLATSEDSLMVMMQENLESVIHEGQTVNTGWPGQGIVINLSIKGPHANAKLPQVNIRSKLVFGSF